MNPSTVHRLPVPRYAYRLPARHAPDRPGTWHVFDPSWFTYNEKDLEAEFEDVNRAFRLLGWRGSFRNARYLETDAGSVFRVWAGDSLYETTFGFDAVLADRAWEFARGDAEDASVVAGNGWLALADVDCLEAAAPAEPEPRWLHVAAAALVVAVALAAVLLLG